MSATEYMRTFGGETFDGQSNVRSRKQGEEIGVSSGQIALSSTGRSIATANVTAEV